MHRNKPVFLVVFGYSEQILIHFGKIPPDVRNVIAILARFSLLYHEKVSRFIHRNDPNISSVFKKGLSEF